MLRALFPKDPLVDQNHSAFVDAMQLAQILRLVAELSKLLSERNLLKGLLEGLKELEWLDEGAAQNNTLDLYFESLAKRSGQTNVRIHPDNLNGGVDLTDISEGLDQEKFDDMADESVEGITALGEVGSDISREDPFPDVLDPL